MEIDVAMRTEAGKWGNGGTALPEWR